MAVILSSLLLLLISMMSMLEASPVNNHGRSTACTSGECQNGGSCQLDLTCLCPDGFTGDLCEIEYFTFVEYDGFTIPSNAPVIGTNNKNGKDLHPIIQHTSDGDVPGKVAVDNAMLSRVGKDGQEYSSTDFAFLVINDNAELLLEESTVVPSDAVLVIDDNFVERYMCLADDSRGTTPGYTTGPDFDKCHYGYGGDEKQQSNFKWIVVRYLDTNECDTDNGGCDHTCTNTDGSYTCSCNTGYALDGDGHTCTDINECDTSNGGCDHTCTNTDGSYTCSCNTGYALDGDGHTCTDINECDTDNGGCDQTCTNTYGSYTCSCNTGYAGDGQTCTDINECDTGNGGCDDTCTNNDGSYTCSCNTYGYALDGDEHTCTELFTFVEYDGSTIPSNAPVIGTNNKNGKDLYPIIQHTSDGDVPGKVADKNDMLSRVGKDGVEYSSTDFAFLVINDNAELLLEESTEVPSDAVLVVDYNSVERYMCLADDSRGTTPGYTTGTFEKCHYGYGGDEKQQANFKWIVVRYKLERSIGEVLNLKRLLEALLADEKIK